MTELQLRITIGLLSALAGGLIGFYIGIRKAKKDPKLTALQILSSFIFAGYIAFAKDPSDVVAIAILTLLGGELIGNKIAEKVDRFKK